MRPSRWPSFSAGEGQRVPARHLSRGRERHRTKIVLSASVRRRALCLTFAAVVTATACRPTPAEEQAAERVVLPNVSRALRYIAATHPQGGNLSEVAAGLASLVDNALAIKPKLDKIAASEEPFGEALVIATCYGLSHIARQAEETQGPILPPPAEEWERFLTEELTVLLRSEAADAIRSRVEQFNNAAQLAAINPHSAHIYVQQCALRSQ
jgi:hypothetical protein